MELILIIFFLWGIVESIFFIIYRRPLNEKEIERLSIKRREKYIQSNYSFKATNISPTKEFKSSLKPQGKLYTVNIPLQHFPSYTAQLLKGKKHEWVVLAFVKDTDVKCFYANKGFDNASVSFNCDIYEIIELCKKQGYQTIMRFHNHPNSDPAHYTHFLASEQDIRSAHYLSSIVLGNGLNWLDFVCERGNFLEFHKTFSVDFFPENSQRERIENENGISKFGNYKLHRELRSFR